jgi:hypothetical protein
MTEHTAQTTNSDPGLRVCEVLSGLWHALDISEAQARGHA